MSVWDELVDRATLKGNMQIFILGILMLFLHPVLAANSSKEKSESSKEWFSCTHPEECRYVLFRKGCFESTTIHYRFEYDFVKYEKDNGREWEFSFQSNCSTKLVPTCKNRRCLLVPSCLDHKKCKSNELCWRGACTAFRKNGESCTTSGTRGFPVIPCEAGLVCQISNPGSPKVDIPNSGVCR